MPVNGEKALFDEAFLRRLEALRLVLWKPAGGAYRGPRVFGERGGAVEFSGHRPYAPGDDVRCLDWSAWARLDKLVIREFHREEGARVHILVDRTLSMNFGRPTKFDAARRLAGALAYLALAGEDEATIGFFGREMNDEPALHLRAASGGTGAVHGLFTFLAEGRPEGRGTLADAAGEFLVPSRPRGPVIVLSDFWDESDAATLRQFAERGFDPVAVRVWAREEEDPPEEGFWDFTDSETGAVVSLPVGAPERKAYAERLAAHRAEFDAFCRKRGIRCAHLTSDRPIEDALLTVLQKERVLT